MRLKVKALLLLFIAEAALIILFFAAPVVTVLSITNRKNPAQKVFSKDAVDGFVISYTHSVNKGRVHDYYFCNKDGTLTVDKTVFVSYGAGIPEPDETPGAVFTVTDEGYEISNLNRKIPSLVIAVGVIAEHSITVGYEEVFLNTLFAPQTSIRIKTEKVSAAVYLSSKKL